jgi:hypothetical protein
MHLVSAVAEQDLLGVRKIKVDRLEHSESWVKECMRVLLRLTSTGKHVASAGRPLGDNLGQEDQSPKAGYSGVFLTHWSVA